MRTTLCLSSVVQVFKVQTIGDAYVVVAGLPYTDVRCFNCKDDAVLSPVVPVRAVLSPCPFPLLLYYAPQPCVGLGAGRGRGHMFCVVPCVSVEIGGCGTICFTGAHTRVGTGHRKQ